MTYQPGRYHIPTEQLEAKREELLKQLAEIEAALDRRYEDEAGPTRYLGDLIVTA